MPPRQVQRVLIPGTVGTLVAGAVAFLMPLVEALAPWTNYVSSFILLATISLCVVIYRRTPSVQPSDVTEVEQPAPDREVPRPPARPGRPPMPTQAQHAGAPRPAPAATPRRPSTYDAAQAETDRTAMSAAVLKIPTDMHADWSSAQSTVTQVAGYPVGRDIYRLLGEIRDSTDDLEIRAKVLEIVEAARTIRAQVAAARARAHAMERTKPDGQ